MSCYTTSIPDIEFSTLSPAAATLFLHYRDFSVDDASQS
jgi:hypothetical protein